MPQRHACRSLLSHLASGAINAINAINASFLLLPGCDDDDEGPQGHVAHVELGEGGQPMLGGMGVMWGDVWGVSEVCVWGGG